MKYIAILYLFITIVLVESCTEKQSVVTNQDIWLEEKLQYSDTLQCPFFIVNNSNANKKIKNIVLSCGCMNVSLSDSVVIKNDSIELGLAIVHKVQDSIIQKTVRVIFDDASEQFYTLHVPLKMPLICNPPSKSIVFKNHQKQSEFVLINNTGSTIQIDSVYTSNHAFSISNFSPRKQVKAKEVISILVQKTIQTGSPKYCTVELLYAINNEKKKFSMKCFNTL